MATVYCSYWPWDATLLFMRFAQVSRHEPTVRNSAPSTNRQPSARLAAGMLTVSSFITLVFSVLSLTAILVWTSHRLLRDTTMKPVQQTPTVLVVG